jgi:DNA polymerase-4
MSGSKTKRVGASVNSGSSSSVNSGSSSSGASGSSGSGSASVNRGSSSADADAGACADTRANAHADADTRSDANSAVSVDTNGLETLIPWEGSAILLLDLDAFFASVEQLDHPEWRGKPVIVGGDRARRGVVSTCSYEARAYGVRSAMPSAQAARICPDAIWTPGNFPRYIALSQKVMQIMEEVSPRLQQVSIDEAFLDISPGRFVRDHPIRLANHIREKVARLGITCSIGLGTSKSVAKVASDMDKPNGLTVVFPGREADFLSPLPIRTMSGVGRQAEKHLHGFGVYTLGDLAAADEGVLRQIFGKNATMMRNRCLGINDSPVTTEDEVKSVSNEMTFSTDLTERTEIEQSVAMLAAKVGRRLRHRRLTGYTVGLKVRYADLSIANAQHTLDRPVDDEYEFTPYLFDLINQVWQPGTKLRLVGVAVSSFGSRPEQLSLFESLPPPNTSTASATNTRTAATSALGVAGVAGASSTAVASNVAGASSTAVAPSVAGKTGTTKARQNQSRRSLIEATDRVKDRFGEEAVGYGREMRFHDRDTGTIAQKKDDYKDPLNPEAKSG